MIMNAKEKAKEIYFSMLNASKGMISDHLAKECSKIMIEELIIISIVNKEYWKKVKFQLEKL